MWVRGAWPPGFVRVGSGAIRARLCTERVLYRFAGAPDGNEPVGELIADANGVLYGIAASGGSTRCTYYGINGCGAVFKLTPASSGYVESILYAFADKADGGNPAGTLLMDAKGALYGATFTGGIRAGCAYGCGTIFTLVPTSGGYVESVLYAFKGGSDGAFPNGALVADATGSLYGTNAYGHHVPYKWDAVFKLVRAGSGYQHSVLHQFQAGPDGKNPYAGLIVGANGNLYGTTSKGGGSHGSGHGRGTVFEVMP